MESDYQLYDTYNKDSQSFEEKLKKLKADYSEAIKHNETTGKWSGPNYITTVKSRKYNIHTFMLNEKQKNYATFIIHENKNKFPQNKDLGKLFGYNDEPAIFDIYFPDNYTYHKNYVPLAREFWENLNTENLSNYATNQRNEKPNENNYISGTNPLFNKKGGHRLRKTKTKTMGKRIRRLRKRTHRYIRR